MSERLMYNDGFLGNALDRLADMREAHWDEANRWRTSIEPNDPEATYKEARMAEEIRSVYDAPDRIVVARSELRAWANRNETGEPVWRDIDAVLMGNRLT